MKWVWKLAFGCCRLSNSMDYNYRSFLLRKFFPGKERHFTLRRMEHERPWQRPLTRILIRDGKTTLKKLENYRILKELPGKLPNINYGKFRKWRKKQAKCPNLWANDWNWWIWWNCKIILWNCQVHESRQVRVSNKMKEKSECLFRIELKWII